MTREAFEHIAQKLRPRLLTVGRDFFGNNDTAEDRCVDVTQNGAYRYFADSNELTISAILGHIPVSLKCREVSSSSQPTL